MQKIGLFGLIVSLLCLGFSAVASERTEEDPAAIWSAWGGTMEFELRGDFLPDYGLEIVRDGRRVTSRARMAYTIRDLGSISFDAPFGHFRGFRDGRVEVATDIRLLHGSREVSLERLILVPATNRNGHPVLEARDADGRHLLTISHIHIFTEPDDNLLTLHNADVLGTPELAEALDMPVLSGNSLGMAWLDLNLRVPEGADLSGEGGDIGGRGLSCTGRPFWPQGGTEIDVGLIGIGTVAYQGTESGTGMVKAAPSATLKNFSEGDVPWIAKFSSLGAYPHTPEDQHPFLVWNMYRISDGRIEQLAESGVKHAFTTLNFSCSLSCGYINGSILAPGCEDVYSSGTNDSNSNQGPREDIEASQGLFLSTCSFFDPGCNGTQTNNSSSFENRLIVHESELDTPDADYFFDSWYVIQYDTDIWNSMGYHPINPAPSGGGWSFNPGTFSVGTPIENWVSENATDPMEAHEVITVPSETPGEPYPGNMPQGHLRLLVKVTEIEPDRYRYNYALMNYDFDRGVTGVSIPKAESALVFETYFGDIDDDAGNDWTVTDNGTSMDYTAAGEDDKQTWFRLYNYEIETSAEPVNAQVTLNFASGVSPASMTVKVPTPGEFVLPEEFFKDGFESDT